MNFKKLAQKTFFPLVITSLISSQLVAKTIDIQKEQKDIKIVTRILETSLESSSDGSGRIRIEGTYLATQGYLFNIRLNRLSSFGIPGIASWEGGRVEIDIPELINEALETIEETEAFALAPEAVIDSFESLYNNDEYQEQLRELRKKQRDARRQTHQLRRDIRQAEVEKIRQKLEQQLEQKQELLTQYKKQYNDSLNSYKEQRNSKRIKKSMQTIDAIFTSVCDYGQSFRALKPKEKVTLVINGSVNKYAVKATQVYVLSQSAVKNCSNSAKLKSSAIHYSY